MGSHIRIDNIESLQRIVDDFAKRGYDQTSCHSDSGAASNPF